MADNTVVLRGAGPGIRLRVPAEARVTVASKGKLTDLKVTPKTLIKFAA